jgi:hypothetical protein
VQGTVLKVRFDGQDFYVRCSSRRELTHLRRLAKNVNRRITVAHLPTISLAEASATMWRANAALDGYTVRQLVKHLDVLEALWPQGGDDK